MRNQNAIYDNAKPVLWLMLLSAFCCAFEVIRIVATDSRAYLFLVFNLLLAWAPLLFAWMACKEENNIKLMLYFLGWLVFFPNAPYIVTDLVHLKPRNNFPLCFDCLLIYSFAFSGFMAGIFSALLIYRRIRTFLPVVVAKSLMLFAMLLSGYAIYIGRFLRWNSWDIIIHPLSIASDTVSRIIHPFHHSQTYAVTITAGVLLSVSFLLFESLTPHVFNSHLFIAKQPESK